MSPSVGTKGLSKAIGVIQGGEMTEPEGSIHFSACLKTKVTHQGSGSTSEVKVSSPESQPAHQG